MGTKKHHISIITGNDAAAEAVKLCGVQVVAAYPITPQSSVVEALSKYVEQGIMNAEFVTVESEHSALGVCIAASTVGARVFTATSANGLAYMCEQVHWAAGARLPIVMCCVNRAMAAPWSVLNDQQDSMTMRDAGWIQIFCRNNQEIHDTVIQAFKIAETVHVPVMVCYDGYILSHTVMPVELVSQEKVDAFLPKYVPHTILDPSHPRNLNPVTLADPRKDGSGTLCHGYMELRYLHQEALLNSPAAIVAADKEFGKLVGRNWGGMVWGYRNEDAEILLMAAGSLTMELSVAVDAMREEGIKVGVLGLRVYRPFPNKELVEAVRKAKLVAVFDKSLSYGNEGPICADLKSALYTSGVSPVVHGYITGLGGRDVKYRHLIEAAKKSIAALNNGNPVKETEWVNVQI
ncbi:MAG TPA: transketolase C-terminal domain-containing protein [Candidatus Hydrogenedentes bacterium]|nr:transketolase C-terminal domain-containing protein [Candidatus Hydrogenedentota bacterium]